MPKGKSRKVPFVHTPGFDPEIEDRLVEFDKDYCDWRKSYTGERIQEESKRQLLKKLAEYERLKLREFRSVSSLKEWHEEGRSNRQPPEELSPDVSDSPIWRFRGRGRMRVLGYLRDNVFFVIWIDPMHRTGA